MATHTYTSSIRHSSDADFRAWGSAISAGFAAVGLVQTTDTGQIDWVTVNRPATNTNAGYQIWRMDDTQQGAAPVFFRIDFGTHSALTNPRIQIGVGTGSNGSGTLNGVTLASITTCPPITTTATSYTTRMCAVDGAFCFVWALGVGNASSPAMSFFALCRSVDSSGVATADAAQVYRRTAAAADGSSDVQVILYASSSTVTAAIGSQCLVHYGVSSSLVGGNAQVYKHYMITPRVRPHPWILTTIAAEIGNNTQFQATPIGVTQRNYISTGVEGVKFAGVALPASANYCIAFIWE